MGLPVGLRQFPVLGSHGMGPAGRVWMRMGRPWQIAVRSLTLVYVQAETESSSSQRLRQSEPGMVRAGAWASANIAPEPPPERCQAVIAGSLPTCGHK